MIEVVRFPSTPHLAWLSQSPVRGDKVLSALEAEALLSSEVTVEEKLDGANVGIAANDGRLSVWNRGTVLDTGSHPQFAPLFGWLAARQRELVDALGSTLVLFGEWCFARHSRYYDRLPDWLIAFDVFDRVDGAFLSVARRNPLCAALGLSVPPVVARGHVSLKELTGSLLQTQSAFGSAAVEGLYVRVDHDEHLAARAKLVSPTFTQAIAEHWRNRPLERNRLAGA